MTDYPLQIFLTSLHSDGIAISVRDYKQLLIIFQTGGNWTVSRLKNVLTAFLAIDIEQQELIHRRFDKYFEKEMEPDKELSEFDICQVINDLKALSTNEHSCTLKTPSEIKQVKPMELEVTQKKSKYWWGLAVLLIVMIVIIGAIMMKNEHTIINVPELKSAIELSHQVLNFGFKDINTHTYKQITISNNGSKQIGIQDIRKLNETSEPFIISTTNLPIELHSNENIVISVGFNPKKEGVFINHLEIIYNAEKQDDHIAIAIKGTAIKSVPQVRKRLYTDVPYIKEIRYEKIEQETSWKIYVGISLILLLCLLIYSYYLYSLKKGPKNKKAKSSTAGPKFFDPNSIGGKLRPRLDENTLVYLADSMSYFKSTTPSKELNVPNSIKTTVYTGGIPSCEFFARKKVRTLVILEDAYAEALDWNPVSKELADGMIRYGIPVIFGKFRGTPDKFKAQDGTVFHLDDLEDHRHGILLLVFTDGKSFQGLKNKFDLEAIARWPMVAWMELRNKRFWDESSDLPIQYNIPVYPATSAGLVQAINDFLTEQGLSDKSTETITNKYLPNIYRKKPELWIEHFLGDALLWAQDCAMIQPISSSMAQNLREEFYPHLSEDQIECLHALPNTTTIESNIHFSNEMLKTLRKGFMSRKTEDEQNQIIQFILDQVEKAKPDVPKDCLAYLTWESIKERVRLEMGNDCDLKRFEELLNSPLGESISDRLANFSFYDDDKIPIREPKNKKAKLRLAKVYGNPLGINLISNIHKVYYILLLLSVSLTFGWSIQLFLVANADITKVEIVGSTEIAARLERWENNYWKYESTMNSIVLLKKFLQNDTKYRLFLYRNGFYTVNEFCMTNRVKTIFIISEKDIQKKCIEEYPDIGLTVKRCSENEITQSNRPLKKITWKNRISFNLDRFQSIGLEFVNENLSQSGLIDFRNILLETGSIDFLYSIQSQTTEKKLRALRLLSTEIHPSSCQLVSWSNYKIAVDEQAGIERILDLGNISSLSNELKDVFEPGYNTYIFEKNLLNKIVNAKVIGKGQPVVLLRPESKYRAPNPLAYNKPSEIWFHERFDQLLNPWIIVSSQDNVPIYHSNKKKLKKGTANFLDKFEVIRKEDHSIQIRGLQGTNDNKVGWVSIDKFLIFEKALQSEYSIFHKAVFDIFGDKVKKSPDIIRLRRSPHLSAPFSKQNLEVNNSDFYFIFQYYPNEYSPEYVLLGNSYYYLFSASILNTKDVILGWASIKDIVIWSNREGYLIKKTKKENYLTTKMNLLKFNNHIYYDNADDNVIFINRTDNVNSSKQFVKYILLSRKEIENFLQSFAGCIEQLNIKDLFYDIYKFFSKNYERIDPLTIEKAFRTKFGIQMNIDCPLFKIELSQFLEQLDETPEEDLYYFSESLCKAIYRLKKIYHEDQFFTNFHIKYIWVEETSLP